MVYCAAFDCNNDSRYTTGISYHCFPRDEALRSQWLAKISRADLVVSKNSKLCSEHFTPDCYERDLKAEILGLKPRSTLKPGAIPTVFSHRRPSKKTSTFIGETFRRESQKRTIARTKRWLRPGSSAHNALKEVVFDKNLLKDIQQLTLSCHTGNLEVYHSVQTKYAPKRQHFSYNGMVARTQLAALDHNANTGRQQATVSRGANQGELQYKVVFPKIQKEWVAKLIFEKTTN
ncbi:unnamed protein product, partial [Pocillopora meandrina]